MFYKLHLINQTLTISIRLNRKISIYLSFKYHQMKEIHLWKMERWRSTQKITTATAGNWYIKYTWTPTWTPQSVNYAHTNVAMFLGTNALLTLCNNCESFSLSLCWSSNHYNIHQRSLSTCISLSFSNFPTQIQSREQHSHTLNKLEN